MYKFLNDTKDMQSPDVPSEFLDMLYPPSTLQL